MKIRLTSWYITLLVITTLPLSLKAATQCCDGREYDDSRQGCCGDGDANATPRVYTYATEGCCSGGALTLHYSVYNTRTQECCYGGVAGGSAFPSDARVTDLGHCCSSEGEYDPSTQCCQATDDTFHGPNVIIDKHTDWTNLAYYCNYGVTSPYWIPSVNGCTGAPDSPMSGVSFQIACNGHDDCYGRCHGIDSYRTTCDNNFEADLDSACDAAFPNDWVRHTECLGFAATYATAVQMVGASYYHDGQAEGCDCCN